MKMLKNLKGKYFSLDHKRNLQHAEKCQKPANLLNKKVPPYFHWKK